MNYIIENMKSRRTIRSYLGQPVPKKLIDQILEAARFAPSALNKQPWEFVVVNNKKLIKDMSGYITGLMKKIYKMQPVLKYFSSHLKDERTITAIKRTATSSEDTVFYNAPTVIFIVSRQKDRWVQINCALAAQNMMLAAHSLSLGSCFVGRGMLLKSNTRLLKKIGIKKGYKIYATLSIGYPKEFRKTAPQRRKDNILCWKD